MARLFAVLETGRREFLEATRDIPLQHAWARPDARGWSVLECIEHVAMVRIAI